MSESLQDQLRKAGLVKEKQVKKTEKQHHAADVAHRQNDRQNNRQQPPGQQVGNRPASPYRTPGQQAAARAAAEKAERDRQANQKKQEKLRQQALGAEIHQLIQQHRVAKEPGELAYHFRLDKKIMRIYLNAAQRDDVMASRLAIAISRERFDLVSLATAEKIKQRNPRRVFIARDHADKTSAGDTGNGEDDEYYKKFQVPDDLDW